MSRRNEHLLNTTRNCYREKGQVLPLINITLAWVEEGVSYRELTLSESIQARMHQRSLQDGLGSVELPGLIYQPPVNAKASQRQCWAILRQTAEFYRDQVN